MKLSIPHFSRRLIISIATISIVSFASYAQDNTFYRETRWPELGLYINAGAFGDFNLDGYESAFVDREPRIGYQVEIGSKYFAIPVSYSGGQGVDIIGVKPRVHYLIPIGTTIISAGPGLGMVYNYWKSDIGVGGADFSVTVHEVGVQPSLQVMIRPLQFLHILVTPVAVDFNFWRDVKADSSIRGLGNFSTTNTDLGIIYTGGVSLGLNF